MYNFLSKLVLFKLFFLLTFSNYAYSYGGPSVNDRNVRPVYTPKFQKGYNKKLPGKINLNNSGSKNSGYTKSTFSYSFKDVIKNGDNLGVKQIHTAGNGTNYYEINNKTPLNNGAEIFFRTGRFRYDLDHYSLSLGLEGHSNFFDIDYIMPLFENKKSKTKYGIGYYRGNFRVDKNRGGEKEEDTMVHKVNFMLKSSIEDSIFQKAKTNLRVIFSYGKVQLADDATNLSPSNDSAQVNGYFAKINPAFARREKINDKTSLILKFKGQHALNNLEGSEEFSLGGFYNVRTYPNNQGSGDSGYISTIEIERSIIKGMNIGLLYDYGKIWENHNSYSGNSNYSYDLSNGGAYINWKNFYRGFNLKAMYIDRLGARNPGERSDATDFDRSYHPQKFLFSLTKSF